MSNELSSTIIVAQFFNSLNRKIANVRINKMNDNIEDFCSYEVDMNLKEWINIHDFHQRGRKTVNLDGVNNIYFICKDCKSVLIHDSF